ncbi:MAG: FecR domain-containing protein, partial [Bacteroidetes bacterium]|nr:FecR domain-containing protein [Bacteroidota bacterium]
ELAAGHQEKNWEAIEAALQAAEAAMPRARRVRRVVSMMVTSVLILALAGSVVWYAQRKTQPLLSEVVTRFGEIKRITLPDGSLVVLNANSVMRLPQNWSNTEDRQVWLEGEAYFEVAKKPSTHQKFVVHAPMVDVQVLGTRFNVNTRRRQSIVSLEEGRVQLVVQGVVKEVVERSKGKSTFQLAPGETAIIDTAKEAVINENKEVVFHSGWSRNEFHFDHTPLSQVAGMIEDVYGYKMQYADTSYMSRNISGDLRAANINEFVRVLEVALHLKLTIENKTILVDNMHR